MERFLLDFDIPAKDHSSDEALRKWRDAAISIVKSRRQRFRFAADLEKRSYERERSKAALKKWQFAISRVKDRVRRLLICGRKPVIETHGIKEEVDDIIDPILRKQMGTQSLAVFTKITYNCLNQQLVQRPTMDQIVKELEDVLELQWKHENLEHSTVADEGTSLNSLKLDFIS
ncbi:hypothetical protein E3N88_33211 [Mikania micrantha]|uniref:Calcium-transporting P-type ATPase N-terminal autoinhibitory domain-containing protein n=1 Tax=Mikania micrantha TaxID=192012 RepID=A0A5N6MBZ0_9ASTR|nr:hypothetical protein E3N88_33211 [Mikania micrantha]